VNRFKKIMSLLLILIIFSLNGCNKATKVEELPDIRPKDFSFVFNYGVDSKNQLDSTKGQYTKDMVSDPSVTLDLILSDEELDFIYSEMKKIKILNYPEEFKPENNLMSKPFVTYSLKIIFNGREKNIHWEYGNVWGDEIVSETKEAIELRELFKTIKEIIINKDEYKKLPQAKGGYC